MSRSEPHRAPGPRRVEDPSHARALIDREIQLLRGSITTKRVASKQALQELESVPIDSLPEDDRSESTIIISFVMI